ncbi:carboxy terminal WSC domain-containing protein [Stachybotrys elegans]|uniref:Carboxy terminal WSC domain-containing protein n=1 Tax=Stachybotrys elegans TaxID=80388 RepID=A0A8K0SPG0_9HYPO|nr:carboxy terminal WSC domain-containing protein [Stachybotrys elegans]
MKLSLVLLGLADLAAVWADPTWPSQIDELEEIMFQQTSFRARRFSGSVSPCSSEASGPGRQNAAEWLRTAFHDMSTANTFFGTGGLDGSLQYELGNSENLGPGLRTTLQFMVPFFSRRSSLSDLIALGVYTSVRSCGGPIVPIRAGRIDATRAGAVGVPQPQNSVFTFQQQFERLGFSTVEMIQVTACGHTIGGVHTAQFPDILPAANADANGQRSLDSSVAVFDNRVVTEYLTSNTTNPLVVGPSVRINRHSDFKVFNSDRNVTMNALADPTAFRNACRAVLQKMVDVVPPNVALTEPIAPYMVKPVNLQLALMNGGSTLQFTGFIRVRTTEVPREMILNVVITYKNRDGGSTCGSAPCTITTTVQGVSQGFDDTFAFYPILYNIPAATGISSFIVTINHVDGTSETYDNNGNEYPMSDAVFLQPLQSCILGSTGVLRVTAAVRNDRISQGARAFISFKVPQTNSPVPLLGNATITMEQGNCAGRYTFFSANYTITGGMAYESNFDVINGDRMDAFKSVSLLGGTCRAFANPIACVPVGPSTSLTTSTRSSSISSSSGSSSSSTTSTTASTTPSSTIPSSTIPSSTTLSSTTPSSTTLSSTTPSSTTPSAPVASPYHRSRMGDYQLISCWTEGEGVRALNARSYAADNMTLEACMGYCAGYTYWGTEYSRECYCGNTLVASSDEAPMEDCSMLCAGDGSQYCGGGSRLELYSLVGTQTRTSSPTPRPTPSHRAEIGRYDLVGCWSEGVGSRALAAKHTASSDMTNDMCAEFCDEYKYFGTEYGSECYCGNSLHSSSASAPQAECRMRCSGDGSQFCGAGDRLELYMDPDLVVREPEQPAAAGDFVALGCQTEVQGRALRGPSLADDGMTNEMCAEFCAEFEYFGTEYGRECYCGDSLPETSTEAPAADCRMLCAGSRTEFCGGPDRLSTYIKQQAMMV